MPSPPSKDLGRALRELVTSPRTSLWPAWSWKAASISMMVRASTFFLANLRSGRREAFAAFAVEAVFAIFAAGLLGAISQHLRKARPYWATALVVWFGMPLLITTAQFGVHHLAGTVHVGTGLLVSFLFASIASSFSWYAMSRGALLGGDDSTTLAHDAKAMPRIVLDYILAVPRMILSISEK